LPLVRWFQTMYLMSQSKNNISGPELKRQLGVCYRTAWLVKQKLMMVMRERKADGVIGGRVIADDAYLGGERRGKRGRGSENKVPFIGSMPRIVQCACDLIGSRVFARMKSVHGHAVSVATEYHSLGWSGVFYRSHDAGANMSRRWLASRAGAQTCPVLPGLTPSSAI